MNRVKSALLLASLSIAGISFHNFTFTDHKAETCLNLPTELFTSIDSHGRIKEAERQQEPFLQTSWEEIGFPVPDEKTRLALHHHTHILRSVKGESVKKVGNLTITNSELSEALGILLDNVESGHPHDVFQYLDAYQVWGDDRKGSVNFTGYFTPVLKVKSKKDKKYKYPIYAMPQNRQAGLPSRREIDEQGALLDQGLELAYASNRFDIYTMQLQGSGSVEYVDSGERMIFKYAGENGLPYRNIENFFKSRPYLSVKNTSLEGIRKFLKENPEMTDSLLFYNPSYTFFTPKKGLVKGAGNVPLMEDVSIAADPKYFPAGSVILAAFPVVHLGKVTHHEYRLLLPQDVGGAIRGAGHVDVYCGNGELGQSKASALNHYGKMWILLPKKNSQVAMR